MARKPGFIDSSTLAVPTLGIARRQGRVPQRFVNVSPFDRDGKIVTRLYLGRDDDPETHRRYLAGLAEWVRRGAAGVPSHDLFDLEAAAATGSGEAPTPAPAAAEPEDDRPTLAEALDEYRDHLADHRRTEERSFDAHLSTIDAAAGWLARVLPRQLDTALEDVTAAHFDDMLDLLVETDNPRTGRPYSVLAVNGYLGTMRSVFKWLASRKRRTKRIRVEAKHYADLTTVETIRVGETRLKPPKQVPPVDMDVFRATLDYVGEIVRDMMTLQMWLGARPGEICKLTSAMIDTTPDASGCWRLTLAHHKTGHRGKAKAMAMRT